MKRSVTLLYYSRNDNERFDIPTKGLDVLNQWKLFTNLCDNGFVGKLIIIVYKFNKLDAQMKV